MERETISSKLKEIMTIALGAKAEEILKGVTEQSNLVNDLGLNSVGILYLVIGMEETFSISFDDVAFSDFETVGDVIDYIENRLK